MLNLQLGRPGRVRRMELVDEVFGSDFTPSRRARCWSSAAPSRPCVGPLTRRKLPSKAPLRLHESGHASSAALAQRAFA